MPAVRGRRAVTVVSAGIGTTVQDHGRPGFAHLGVPRAGVIDRPLADLVCRVVGDDPGTAVFETVGGLTIRAGGSLVVASTTATAPLALEPGEVFRVDAGGERNYEYVAVRGGLVVDRVLGSASRDTLSSLGPPPVTDGQVYGVGPDPGRPIITDSVPVRTDDRFIRLWPGPRLDRFAPDALAMLCSAPWTVGAEISRVGVRLNGGNVPLRDDDAELPSEGLVAGAVQLPPNGEPVVMLADHPTTGGYPVVAVVDPADLPSLAQRRPSGSVRFVAVR